MIREEKYHYDFPCFVASFISLFILVGLGLLESRVPPVVYRGGSLLGMQLFVCVLFPYPRSSTKTSQVNGPYASAPAWRRGPLCVVRVVGQRSGSLCSSCLRIFSALDGWEDVGDPELLVDTSE